MKQITPIYGQDYGPGFIGFSNCPGNDISEGIVWFENLEESMQYGKDLLDGGISHVFLVKDEKNLLESAEHGVQWGDLQARIADPSLKIVFREPVVVTPDYVKELFYGVESEIGQPYDYTGLVGHILQVFDPFIRIFPFLKKWPVPLHLIGEYCSAYASHREKQTALYHDAKLFQEWNETRISPNMLWNHFPLKSLRFDKER